MKKLRLPPKYENKENLNEYERKILEYYEDFVSSMQDDDSVVIVFNHGADFEDEE